MPMPANLTAEQAREMDATIERLKAKYGARLYTAGSAFMTLTGGLLALCHDSVPEDERKEVYDQCAQCLKGLIQSLGQPGDEEKVVEIARQIDTVVDMWCIDNVEKRRGLPPVY